MKPDANNFTLEPNTGSRYKLVHNLNGESKEIYFYLNFDVLQYMKIMRKHISNPRIYSHPENRFLVIGEKK
jgi:hypothetical protein